MSKVIKEYKEYREKMNEKLLATNNKVIKRIFNLDTKCLLKNNLYILTCSFAYFLRYKSIK